MRTLLEVTEGRRSKERNTSFALRRIQGYSEMASSGEILYKFDTVDFSTEKPLATTPAERKAMISANQGYWFAAGGLPIIFWKDGVADVAVNYRDSGAPSYPDHYNLAGGLSEMTADGRIEEMSRTMKREMDEEVIFLDRELAEVTPIYKDVYDPSVSVEENYLGRNGRPNPLVNAWSVNKPPGDPVPTVSCLRLYFPDMARDDAYVVNGEISADTRVSKKMVLMSLDDLFAGGRVGSTSYTMDIYGNRMESLTGKIDGVAGMKMVPNLSIALSKVLGMGSRQFYKNFL